MQPARWEINENTRSFSDAFKMYLEIFHRQAVYEVKSSNVFQIHLIRWLSSKCKINVKQIYFKCIDHIYNL